VKILNLRNAKASLSSVIEEAQHERVLVTRHGKPTALIIGVEGEDLEDLLTRSSPEFWKMIEERRKSTRPRISLGDVEERIKARSSTGKRPQKTTPKRKRKSSKPRSKAI
jgi:prevent-host-death family protein